MRVRRGTWGEERCQMTIEGESGERENQGGKETLRQNTLFLREREDTSNLF